MLIPSNLSEIRKSAFSSADRIKSASFWWTVYFVVFMALTCGIGLIGMGQTSLVPLLVWVIFFAGAGTIILRPRYGVYLILFLALAGDSVLLPWYPFLKGLSSLESVLYVNKSLIVSPLEVYILITFISWMGRRTARREMSFFKGNLNGPILILLGFVIFGIVYGLGSGGVVNVALWESRPLFHMIALFILTTNLFKKREQVTKLIWTAILGVFCTGIIADYNFLVDLKGNLDGVESITEHGSAIQINTFFIFALLTWMYSPSKENRWFLLLMSPIMLTVYFAAQRRAAFLSLMVALVVFVLFLYKDFRRIFWLLIPGMMVVATIYGVVFWNSSSKLALPIQSLKTIIAPNSVSARDQASNEYRVLENTNSSFTIHQRPWTGVGFGQKFYIIVPMPDISFFVWWEYITHNSIIWIWMKMGVGGFLALVFLIGMTLINGVRLTMRMPFGDLRAIALSATLYILMHFIYAYVDMSWDTRSMVYIGAMMGLINCLENIVEKTHTPKTRRWPWQPQPVPEPMILPLS
jgi:hypothetical protein